MERESKGSEKGKSSKPAKKANFIGELGRQRMDAAVLAIRKLSPAERDAAKSDIMALLGSKPPTEVGAVAAVATTDNKVKKAKRPWELLVEHLAYAREFADMSANTRAEAHGVKLNGRLGATVAALKRHGATPETLAATLLEVKKEFGAQVETWDTETWGKFPLASSSESNGGSGSSTDLGTDPKTSASGSGNQTAPKLPNQVEIPPFGGSGKGAAKSKMTFQQPKMDAILGAAKAATPGLSDPPKPDIE